MCLYLFLNSSVSCSSLRSLTQCGSSERTGRHLVVGPPLSSLPQLVPEEESQVACCRFRFYRYPLSYSRFHLLLARRRITPGDLAYQPAGQIRLPSATALCGSANFSEILHKKNVRSIEVSRGMVLHRENPYPSRPPQIPSPSTNITLFWIFLIALQYSAFNIWVVLFNMFAKFHR